MPVTSQGPTLLKCEWWYSYLSCIILRDPQILLIFGVVLSLYIMELLNFSAHKALLL